MRTPIIAMLAALAVGLAGCAGGGGGGNATESPDDSDPSFGGNLTAGGNATYGNTTVGGNASAEGNATAQWSSENRSGEVSGVELEANGPEAEESFSVENGTQEMYINITVEGDELEAFLRPPGCEDESCEESVDIGGGSGQVQVAAPEEGSYTIRLQPASLGPVDSTYTVEFSAYVGAPTPL